MNLHLCLHTCYDLAYHRRIGSRQGHCERHISTSTLVCTCYKVLLSLLYELDFNDIRWRIVGTSGQNIYDY